MTDVVELTWLGTDTLHLRVDDFAVLVDPSPSHSLLTTVDLLVSTRHQRLVSQELGELTPVVAGVRDAAALRRRGFREVVPLVTWQSALFRRRDRSVRVTATPATRGIGVQLGFSAGLQVLVAGATHLDERLREVTERLPKTHVLVLRVGGRGRFRRTLMSADTALRAVLALQPDVVVLLHAPDEVQHAIAAACGHVGRVVGVRVPERGRTMRIPYAVIPPSTMNSEPVQ